MIHVRVNEELYTETEKSSLESENKSATAVAKLIVFTALHATEARQTNHVLPVEINIERSRRCELDRFKGSSTRALNYSQA